MPESNPLAPLRGYLDELPLPERSDLLGGARSRRRVMPLAAGAVATCVGAAVLFAVVDSGSNGGRITPGANATLAPAGSASPSATTSVPTCHPNTSPPENASNDAGVGDLVKVVTGALSAPSQVLGSSVTAACVEEADGGIPDGTVVGPTTQLEVGPQGAVSGVSGQLWDLRVTVTGLKPTDKGLGNISSAAVDSSSPGASSGSFGDGARYSISYVANQAFGDAPGPGQKATGPFAGVAEADLFGKNDLYKITIYAVNAPRPSDPGLDASGVVKLLQAIDTAANPSNGTSTILQP